MNGIILEASRWLWWAIIGGVLFIIPGFSLMEIAYQKRDHPSFFEKLLVGIGLSISIYPLLIFFTSLVGLRLGNLYALLPPIGGIILLIINHRLRPKDGLTRQRFRVSWHHLALALVILFVLITRFWVINHLEAPLWGDSVQHTMIAQLIVDNQGLFNSWLPYAELQSFTYHFGFHAIAAVFHWLTGLPLIESVLIVGQIINTLAILTLYPLTMRITRNPWAGIVTILAAGLLFSTPMVYSNWGRYTQLTGLAILPAVIYLSQEILDNAPQKRLYPLIWMTLGGLALTHYRVLIFAIIFYFSYLLVNLGRGDFKPMIKKIAWIGIGGLILTLPWFIHTIAGKLDLLLITQLRTPATTLSDTANPADTFGNLLNYLPLLAWIILPITIGWGFWKRERSVLLYSLWWYLILLAANPQWLRLPGAGVITTFAVMISLYFPASILIGVASDWIISANRSIFDKLPIIDINSKSWKWIFSISAIILVLIVGLFGARQRITDIDIQTYSLLTRSDLNAFEWIRENLPEQASFLVNSFFAYNDSAIAGSDGGWWLSLLTARSSSQPPLPYTSEKTPRPDYIAWINQLPRAIQEYGINHPDVLEELQKRGITHIYIGQRQGKVNSPSPLIQLETIRHDPHFKPIYHQDQVWIFEIIQ